MSKISNQILNIIPGNEMMNVVLIGDFNFDLNKQESSKISLLKYIMKNMKMEIISTEKNTRKEAKLDYAIIGVIVN